MITLPTKKKWFDMIEAGIKGEEYRDLTPHYRSIFEKRIGIPTRVCFRNGYRADSPSFERTVIPRIGCGRPEWGAEPDKGYFVLAIVKEKGGPDEMSIEIGIVRSNRIQYCRKCGRTIPAREESVKTTKKLRGARSLTSSWYTCMECERKGAAGA